MRSPCCDTRMASCSAAKTIVVKIGSAVLTDSRGLNIDGLTSLARQIAVLRSRNVRGSVSGREQSAGTRRIIVVSSGAVAAGRAAMTAHGMTAGVSGTVARHAVAAIGQGLLMQAWNQAFAEHGLLTAQVLLTRDDLRSRARFQTAANTFEEMLAWGVIPIVNENDTVSVSDLKFGDNDCLASLLVNLTGAELFVNLTSAPGVFAENPENNPNPQIMDCIESVAQLDIDSLCGMKTDSGSGGMHSKLMAARRVAQIGVPTLILPGREPDVLLRAFGFASSDEADNPGTWVCGGTSSIPRRKFWLAYQSEPTGVVEVDAGAARALLYNGSSLLPGGITGVQGEFDKGALLRITHDGQNLGVGFSNYASSEILRIKGLKRHEIAAILGKARYPDVIHRDNLLLDAAI